MREGERVQPRQATRPRQGRAQGLVEVAEELAQHLPGDIGDGERVGVIGQAVAVEVGVPAGAVGFATQSGSVTAIRPRPRGPAWAGSKPESAAMTAAIHGCGNWGQAFCTAAIHTRAGAGTGAPSARAGPGR